MFGSNVFQSWPAVLLGALFFSMLFMLLGMMSELVLDGMMRFSDQALSLGLLAFVGYIGVATFIRFRNPSS